MVIKDADRANFMAEESKKVTFLFWSFNNGEGEVQYTFCFMDVLRFL